jgi:metal transporter CNNM
MLARRPQPGLLAARYTVLSIAKAVASLPLVDALPTSVATYLAQAKEPAAPPASPALWIYLTVAIGLVLLGGAFAGLTIALMGQVSTVADLRGERLICARMGSTSR